MEPGQIGLLSHSLDIDFITPLQGWNLWHIYGMGDAHPWDIPPFQGFAPS